MAKLGLTPRQQTALFAVGLFLLAGIAAWSRAGALGPEALWLDDIWVAMIVRHFDLREYLTNRPLLPLGFFVLLRLVVRTLGETELYFQLVPYLAGIATIPLTGLAAARLIPSRSFALLAAALLVPSALLARHSVTVKAFPIDTLFSAGLLLVGLPLLSRSDLGRFAVLVALATTAFLFSFPSVIVSVPLVGVVLLRALATQSPDQGRRHLGVAVGWALCLAVAYLALVPHSSNERLNAYWASHFLPLDPAAAWGFLRTKALSPLAAIAPGAFWFLAAAALAGVFGRLREAPWEALFFLGVFGGHLFLSALEVYPVGGGRTDLFVLPVWSVLCARGLWNACGVWPPLRAGWIALALGAYLAAHPAGAVYTPSKERDVFEELARRERPGDELLLNSYAPMSLGFYEYRDVDLVYAPERGHRVAVRFREPGVTVLPWPAGSRATPDFMASHLEKVFRRAPDRVLFVATSHTDFPGERLVTEQMLSAGYAPTFEFRRGLAALLVFERSNRSAPVGRGPVAGPARPEERPRSAARATPLVRDPGKQEPVAREEASPAASVGR